LGGGPCLSVPSHPWQLCAHAGSGRWPVSPRASWQMMASSRSPAVAAAAAELAVSWPFPRSRGEQGLCRLFPHTAHPAWGLGVCTPSRVAVLGLSFANVLVVFPGVFSGQVQLGANGVAGRYGDEGVVRGDPKLLLPSGLGEARSRLCPLPRPGCPWVRGPHAGGGPSSPARAGARRRADGAAQRRRAPARANEQHMAAAKAGFKGFPKPGKAWSRRIRGAWRVLGSEAAGFVPRGSRLGTASTSLRRVCAGVASSGGGRGSPHSAVSSTSP